MENNSTITLKTITLNKENFLNVINPDQQIENPATGTLAFHSGVYGNKTDDGFLDLCIDLYINGASAHQNLVNLKAGLITGNNLQPEDDTQKAIINPFIAHRNKSGDNLKAVYGKLATDFALFNACVLQVVFNRDGEIAEVYHIPTQNFRFGRPNKYGQMEFGFLSNNWSIISNSRQSKGAKESVKIRMFDPTNWKKYPVQLMYCKSYSYTPYAIPAYTSAINWILISKEIGEFHKNNIRSNFFLGGMLTQKKGGMSDDQIADNANAIEALYKGGTSGKKVLLSYVEDMINDKPVFEKFVADDQDKLFDILSQQSFQQIVTAHNAYSILAGVDSKGADLGGDSNKLITNLSAFNYLVCENYKEIIVSNLNRIMEINQLPPLMVITEMPKITQPQGQPEDTTVNERREMLYGLPEIDNSANNVAPTNEIPLM
jgi:hypothetical protein